MPLTPNQILEIQDIIELHHNAFIANTIGHNALPDEVIDELRDKGLLNTESKDLIKKIYEYGQVLGKFNNLEAQQMSYDRFENYLNKNPQPLTQMQQRAVRMAQVNAGQYCMGLGNLIEKDTGRTLIEADNRFRIQYEDKIKNLTALNVARRESIEKLRSDLGWSTGDWARDMKRIAVTEIMYSTQQGQADYLRKKYGEDVYVSRIPNPGACKHCIRLHIGPDGQPRIFKLSTLEEHGSNVGRKQNDWQTVVGPVHPNCVCNMISVPKGWGFNEEGDLVPGGKLGEVYSEPEELKRALLEEDLFYKSLKAKANITFQGIPIAIETPKGDKRKWINGDGSIGETIMYGASYGFVKRTTSMDEEELDVFVGPFKDSPIVYVIDQKNPNNELYDEQKCMLGFRNEKHALNVYRMNYDNPDRFIYDCSSMDIDAFKRWCGIGIVREEMGKSSYDLSPGPGSGLNFFLGTNVKKPNSGGTIRYKEVLELGKEELEKRKKQKDNKWVYGDVEDYQFGENVVPVKELVIPDTIKVSKKEARKKNKDVNKFVLTRRLKWKKGNVNNFNKSLFIGPRGGKWADPEHTIPWKEEVSTNGKFVDTNDSALSNVLAELLGKNIHLEKVRETDKELFYRGGKELLIGAKKIINALKNKGFKVEIIPQGKNLPIVVLNKPIKKEPIKKEPIKKEPIKKEPIKKEPIKKEPIKKEPIKLSSDEVIKQDKVLKNKKIFNKLSSDYANRINNIYKVLKDDKDFKYFVKSIGHTNVKDTIEYLINKWNETGSDHDIHLIILQKAAMDEFGLDSGTIKHFDKKLLNKVHKIPKTVIGARKFIRAQYNLTQEYLKKQGISEIILFRGMQLKKIKSDGRSKEIDITSQPLSSWSTSFSEAKDFSVRGAVCRPSFSSVLLSKKVPIEQIFSIPKVGIGESDEQECVLLGNKKGPEKVISLAVDYHDMYDVSVKQLYGEK